MSQPHKDILGRWEFSEILLSNSGISRKAKGQNDYYFEFLSHDQVVAHVHGETYNTSYVVKQGCISFENTELATLKLILDKDVLRIQNYFGATLVFQKRPN